MSALTATAEEFCTESIAASTMKVCQSEDMARPAGALLGRACRPFGISASLQPCSRRSLKHRKGRVCNQDGHIRHRRACIALRFLAGSWSTCIFGVSSILTSSFSPKDSEGCLLLFCLAYLSWLVSAALAFTSQAYSQNSPVQAHTFPGCILYPTSGLGV